MFVLKVIDVVRHFRVGNTSCEATGPRGKLLIGGSGSGASCREASEKIRDQF